MEDCFKGGVTTGGLDNTGSVMNNTCKIKWQSDFTVRTAYALTYRYGRPEAHSIFINGQGINWNSENQAGPEQVEIQANTDYFAPHVAEITNSIEIDGEILSVDFPLQQYYEDNDNWGWWGVYVVILYESPEITKNVCTRIYIADQNQVSAQTYEIETPSTTTNTPVLFAIHSSRLSEYANDKSGISINNINIGSINGPDSVNPLPISGVQGHYYYENNNAGGLNGDIANNSVEGQDGVCIINEYLNNSLAMQSVDFYRLHFSPFGGWNPHPSFNITYTPTCPISTGTMPRSYSFCKQQFPIRGQPDIPDTIQFNAISGYDHYAWTPAGGLSDSTIANPLCFADSSQWFRVRMWNDVEGAACAQTIPVFLTVGKVPRPNNLQIKASICPTNTGKITFGGMTGIAPFYYTVNGYTQGVKTFEDLAPGIYDISTIDALGCVWDSTVVIVLNPSQTAAFIANPDSGYSPLRVAFKNKSTQATAYEWQVNGEPFSHSENTSYTFADSGTYIIALIAYRLDNTCADTAYAIIRVEQGLKLIVPNVISPNGDGRNDALVAQTAGVAYIRWEVHNRWGNKLHSGEVRSVQNEVTLWNPENNAFPDGVYTVVIHVQGESGEMRDIIVQVSLVGQ